MKKTKYIESKHKPPFYKFLRWCISLFYKKRKFLNQENILNEPSIYIGNHAQLHGPLTNEMFFPRKKMIWCIGQMMNIKEVPSYSYQDFWSKKPKCLKWFYKLLSYLIAPLSSYIFTHADTIAVYKDSRLIDTYRKTIKALEEDKNIIIFPEKDQLYNEIISEFQDKFVDVARLYYKKTGIKVAFIPMYNSPKLKTVIFGRAIYYDPNININEQRDIIITHLKNEITTLAKSLPPHKVVPYQNISKRKYPMSK